MHVGLTAKLTTRSSLAVGSPALLALAEVGVFMLTEDLSLWEQTQEKPNVLAPEMLGPGCSVHCCCWQGKGGFDIRD